MWYQLLIAIGSGLASAVLFLLPAKGSLAALLIGVLSPLPVMIATMGFGPRSAGLSALAGFLVISIVLHPYLGFAFLLSSVLPAVLLGWLAQRPGIPVGTWASPRLLLIWIVGLSIALDFAGIGLLGLRYASFDAAVSDFAGRFAPMIGGLFGADGVPGGFSAAEFARLLVIAMAPTAAGWGVFALALNLYFAARVAQISGRLQRPWPDLPSTLSLPREALFIFVLALGAAFFLSDLARVLAATVVAALGVGFALHGLGAVHAITRGHAARPGLLAALYAVVLALFPWPLMIAACIGMADLFRPVRRVAPPAKPPTIPKI